MTIEPIVEGIKPMKIKQVYLFQNSMMAVFDEHGEQIAALQAPLLIDWANKAKALGYEVHDLVVEVQNGRNLKLFEWEFDGETGINFEVL